MVWEAGQGAGSTTEKPRSPQLVPGDLGAPLEGLGIGIVAVVNDDGEVFAREEEGDDDVGADVAQTAGDEDFLPGVSGSQW